MDRQSYPAGSALDGFEDEETASFSRPNPKITARFGTMAPELPPPTAVTLPARDASRSLERPTSDTYAGLETLAYDESEEEETATTSGALRHFDESSDLSVVFRGAHQSERPPAAPALRLVPAPGVGRSGPPRPPPPPHASSLPPGQTSPPHVDALTPRGSGSSTSAGLSGAGLPAATSEPPFLPGSSLPPPAHAAGPESHRLPEPPRVPLALAGPTAPADVDYDYDDDVDTTVLPPMPDSMQPVAVSSAAVPTRLLPVERRPPRRPWVALAGACMLGGGVIAAAAMWWEGDRGDLVIDVADQQCGAVEDVKVFVDDELVCTASPCTLRVSSGSHVVQAQADGYDLTAPEAVSVDADVPTLHRIQFGASSRTGIEVRSDGAYSMYLDGKLIGELPQRVTGLSAGEHTLLISGGEGFYAEERKVNLAADKVMVLDDVRLRPRTGTLRIAENDQLHDAVVKLDGERIELPFEGQLDTSRRHHLTAQRAGFEDFETWIEFGGKESTKELNIQLMPSPSGSDDESSSRASRSSTHSSAPHRGTSRRQERSTDSEELGTASHASADTASRSAAGEASGNRPAGDEATGSARLNLQSTPPSAVLLDGKPIGQTPRSLMVTPGTHSVIFVHPEKGRARATAKLAPGQAKTLRARF